MNWAQSHGVAPGASWDIEASALSSPYQRPRSSLKTHRCSEIILLDDERASTRGDVEKLLGSTQNPARYVAQSTMTPPVRLATVPVKRHGLVRHYMADVAPNDQEVS